QAAGAAAAANTESAAGNGAVPSAGALEANAAAATATSAANASKVCYRCDGCNDFPLQHVRYHCLVCADFDLCPGCYELFHGPNNQFQGGNVVMLGGHSTAHRMVALQVRAAPPPTRQQPAGGDQERPSLSNPAGADGTNAQQDAIGEPEKGDEARAGGDAEVQGTEDGGEEEEEEEDEDE
ncbi:unnamed protein product, partial [Sphacelaria rigidula]